MTTSERNQPLYVYLQRPDNGAWVVAGRYRKAGASGEFIYAPSYLEARFTWTIDPVNLPLVPGQTHLALRYQGLFDVLRDAAPDAWGQMLLRKQHGLTENASPLDYLIRAGNGDRWGALAVGASKKASISALASPRLHRLDELVTELLALAEARPAVNSQLRKHLFATPSLGGARPKATIRDSDDYWLVKPGLLTDTVDLALLEHATMQWGRAAGLRFADTRHHPLAGERSVVRVLRFDRHGEQRSMALSAASLLQVQYPPATAGDTEGASYPRLAEELRRIGAPREDLLELFHRMIFNAAVGNDDDHPRNHAAIYNAAEGRWRLSPAFDVVPNPDETPERQAMQVSAGRNDIGRDALLAGHAWFGFKTAQQAASEFDHIFQRIADGFRSAGTLLTPDLRALMSARLAERARRWGIS